VGIEMLSQQDGAPVTESGEVAELVPGIGLGDGFRALKELVADEETHLLGLPQGVSIEA
jgi:hypothetical protein